jgi:16S rRNA (guanine527-N7)-methyltransferase
MIDLGSGAGFPGIPIKVVRPRLAMALVESRRLKSLFLRKAAAALGLLDLVVWQSRIEALAALPLSTAPSGPSGAGDMPDVLVPDPEGPRARPQVDLLTARAVASLPDVARWAAPVVRPGGHLVVFKGSRLDEELRGWSLRPGPWEIALVERDVCPGLSLLALRRQGLPDREIEFS